MSCRILKYLLTLILAIFYAALTIGALIGSWEGFYPPKVDLIKGVVTETNCSVGRRSNIYESFKIEGSSIKYEPNIFDSCEEFHKKVRKGNNVEFHATDDGDIWSFEVNGEPLMTYDNYVEARSLFAPFLALIGTVLVFFPFIFLWAHNRDLKRGNVQNQM